MRYVGAAVVLSLAAWSGYAVPAAAPPAAPAAAPAAALPAPPATTVQELMASQVDPSADALWASVSTVITAAGLTEKQPRTEAEWRSVRRYAATLIEGADALTAPRLRVAVVGRPVEDSAVPGIERPENIQKAIDADPARFAAAAARLRGAGLRALTAIDARDAGQLVEAGGDIDGACEACHLRYWYPHSPRPK